MLLRTAHAGTVALTVTPALMAVHAPVSAHTHTQQQQYGNISFPSFQARVIIMWSITESNSSDTELGEKNNRVINLGHKCVHDI